MITLEIKERIQAEALAFAEQFASNHLTKEEALRAYEFGALSWAHRLCALEYEILELAKKKELEADLRVS